MKKFLVLAVLCGSGICTLTTRVAGQVITNTTAFVIQTPPSPEPGKAVAVTFQLPNDPGTRIVSVVLVITSIREGEVEKPKNGIKVVPPVPPVDATKSGRRSSIVEGPKWDLGAEPMDVRGPFKTESPGLAVFVRHKF